MSNKIIKAKIRLLKDFCILRDEHESTVRAKLETFQSEIALDNFMHDILVGKHTLSEVL